MLYKEDKNISLEISPPKSHKPATFLLGGILPLLFPSFIFLMVFIAHRCLLVDLLSSTHTLPKSEHP